MLGRLLPDRFILWLLAAVALGALLPVRGGAAAAVDALTLAAIFALFFLHGVRSAWACSVSSSLRPGTLGRRFEPASRAAILFCGSVKSLASGAPMARILFPGAAAGLVILPVMIFHTVQLIVCAWIAARLGRAHP